MELGQDGPVVQPVLHEQLLQELRETVGSVETPYRVGLGVGRHYGGTMLVVDVYMYYNYGNVVLVHVHFNVNSRFMQICVGKVCPYISCLEVQGFQRVGGTK